MRNLILFALVSVLASACTPNTYQRGNVQPETQWQALQSGTPKEAVLRDFGSPSSRSSFGQETWYYVQMQKESVAFLKPETTEQKVVAITFDSGGMVEAVKHYALSDRQQVAIIEDQTHTEGHSIGFLEQALGNIGRFGTAPGREINPRGPTRR